MISCLFARREETLQEVKRECVKRGAKEEDVLIIAGDITNPADLIRARQAVVTSQLNQAGISGQELTCARLEGFRYRSYSRRSAVNLHADGTGARPSCQEVGT